MTSLILIANADPFDLRLLSELCVSAGHRVLGAADGRAVLDTMARECPDLVLMDSMLPVMSGFEVLRVLKGDDDLARIPVLLITFEDDIEERRRALELGAEDYVTKSFRVFEIQQRIRNALRLRPSSEASPPPENTVSHQDDVVDALTGAGTANQLFITLDYEFTRAVRYTHPLGCIVVRVANYRNIVETVGADSADGVLVALASGLRRYVRGVDHLFRSAEEEFTMVLPETDLEGCRSVIDRLAEGAEDLSLFAVAVSPHPKIRVGLASYPEIGAEDGKALLKVAIEAME